MNNIFKTYKVTDFSYKPFSLEPDISIMLLVFFEIKIRAKKSKYNAGYEFSISEICNYLKIEKDIAMKYIEKLTIRIGKIDSFVFSIVAGHKIQGDSMLLFLNPMFLKVFTTQSDTIALPLIYQNLLWNSKNNIPLLYHIYTIIDLNATVQKLNLDLDFLYRKIYGAKPDAFFRYNTFVTSVIVPLLKQFSKHGPYEITWQIHPADKKVLNIVLKTKKSAL